MNSYVRHIIEAFDFGSIDNSNQKKGNHITNMAYQRSWYKRCIGSC